MHTPTIYYGNNLLPKKNAWPLIFLFFIPLFFLLFSSYNLFIQGPFYSFTNVDPSYAYLFNGFELLHFHAPGHVDHPGTTTQLLMALIILFTWLITACTCGLTQHPIPSLDHLFYTQPEIFLYSGSLTLILINTLLFSWISLNLFSYTKQLSVVFAFQLGLFVFFPVVNTFSMFTPEPMLLTGLLLCCLAFFPALLKNDVRYFGAALGFSMATKVTFLPLLLFLFFYPRIQRKTILKFTLISFLLCTFPIWGRYLNMTKWLVKIIFHTGNYGTGSIGLIDNTNIINNFKAILTQAPFLLISLGGLSGYLLFTHQKNTRLINKFLCLSMGAMLFSLLLNLKHPGIRYMMPVLLLCAPLFALLAYQFMHKNWRYTAGLFTLIFVGLGLSAIPYQQWHKQRLLENQAHIAFQDYVTHNHCKIIGFYNPSMQSYAMYFGNQWGWKKRVPILHTYYPNSIFFDPENERFYDFHGPNHHQLNSMQVENELKQYACIVFQGFHLSLPEHSHYKPRFIAKSLDNNKTVAGKFYEFIA